MGIDRNLWFTFGKSPVSKGAKSMARRFILADDLDGTESTDENEVLTWTFSYGARTSPRAYTIDLTAENFQKLEEALAPFVEVAQPMQGGRAAVEASEARSRGRGPNRTPEEIEADRKAKEDKANQREEIVAWGKKNPGDFKVNESGRGRLDTALIKAFYDANKDAEHLFTV